MTLSVRNCVRVLNNWEQELLDINNSSRGEHVLDHLFNNEALESRVGFLKQKKFHREKINRLIEQDNHGLKLTGSQKQNLEKIKDPKSCFVITGQQPGLLGGPVYWYYKALTALEAAGDLENKLNIPVIPLFWIAGDDSDLRECNRVELLEAGSGKSVHSLQQDNVKKLIPVSERKLGDSVDILREKLEEHWSSEVMALVVDSLTGEMSFTESFRTMAQSILGSRGLLFLDGNSQKFRELTLPAMNKIISEWDMFESLLKRSEEYIKSRGLVPTAAFREGTVHAFLLKQGARKRIRVSEGNVFKAGDEKLTLEKSIKPSEKIQSANFTHDVVSRPVLIDSVIPVLGHILGPNELGYFNQLPEVFRHFTGEPPLACLRMTAAVVTSKQLSRLEKIGFSESDLPHLKNSVLRKRLIERVWEEDGGDSADFDMLFEKYFSGISEMSEQVIPPGSPVGGHSSGDFKKQVSRVWQKHIQKLKRKHFQNDSLKYQDLFADVKWLGNGAGQDRHLNIFSLMNMLGDTDMDSLSKAVKPLEMEHQLVVLSD